MQQFAVLKRKLAHNIRDTSHVRNFGHAWSSEDNLFLSSSSSLSHSTNKKPTNKRTLPFVLEPSFIRSGENVESVKNQDNLFVDNSGEGEYDDFNQGDFEAEDPEDDIPEILANFEDLILVDGDQNSELKDLEGDDDDKCISESLAQCELDDFHLSDLLMNKSKNPASRKLDIVLPRVRIMVRNCLNMVCVYILKELYISGRNG
jgi:hypothetical protein